MLAEINFFFFSFYAGTINILSVTSDSVLTASSSAELHRASAEK